MKRAFASVVAMLVAAVTLMSPAHGEERMMDVGGYALNVDVRGQGDTFVIFESGFASDLHVWDKLRDTLGDDYTTVAYSRAGLGASENDGEAKPLDRHVADLHTLVATLAPDRKLILVGPSYGAMVLRAFAGEHPDTVRGLVFVDPALAEQRAAFMAADRDAVLTDEAMMLSYMPPAFAPDFKLLLAQFEDGSLMPKAPLPDVPVAVLTSTRVADEPFVFDETAAGKKVWQQLHADFFASVSRGVHIKTAASGHNIHREQPELVRGAIARIAAYQ